MRMWQHLTRFWQRHPYGFVLVLALVLRLAWLGLSQIGVPFQYPPARFPHATAEGVGYTYTPVQVVDRWARWDSVYYLTIAQGGYADPPGNLRVAFFPLFPLLIRGFTQLTGWWDVTCGLLLANAFDVAGWLVLALLARRRLGCDRALVALLAFAIFPTRNFGFSVYTEGLFLLLSAGAFYLHETRRYGRAALLCGVVSGLRPQGILVGVALAADAAWAWWKDKQGAPRPWQLACFALAPAGLLAYMAFLQQTFARPLYFMQIQSVWHRQLTVPLRTFFTSAEPHEHAILLASVSLLVAMIRWRQPLRDCLYVALSLVIPLSTGSLMSVGRFVGVLFPLFFFAVEAVEPKSRWGRVYVTLALIYCCVLAFKVGQGAKVV